MVVEWIGAKCYAVHAVHSAYSAILPRTGRWQHDVAGMFRQRSCSEKFTTVFRCQRRKAQLRREDELIVLVGLVFAHRDACAAAQQSRSSFRN